MYIHLSNAKSVFKVIVYSIITKFVKQKMYVHIDYAIDFIIVMFMAILGCGAVIVP